MKRKIMAVLLSAALCVAMGATAFANQSSNTSKNASSGGGDSSAPAVETPATRGTANTDEVSVAVPGPNGTISRVNLTAFTNQVGAAVVAVAASSANPGEAVSASLTTPASPLFKATINALGGRIRTVNAGGYKVASMVRGADGRTVASLGKVKGVTKYAFVVLTSVDTNGAVEIVEGTVDPVTLQVMGAFVGTPSVVTVSVILAK